MSEIPNLLPPQQFGEYNLEIQVFGTNIFRISQSQSKLKIVHFP